MKVEVKVRGKLVEEQDLHRIQKVEKGEIGLTIHSNLAKAPISYLAGKPMIRCKEVDLKLI